MGQLALVHGGEVLGDVIVGGQQESAGATGGVADGHAGCGAHDVDDGLNQGAGGEVLAGARFHVLGVAFEEGLVGVTLYVGAEG